jgi:large subunit ribosomal protein L4e
MAAATHPLVTVKDLDGDMATDSTDALLPNVLRVSIRPDLIRSIHKLLSCNKHQPYVVSRRAGHQTSVESKGMGRAVLGTHHVGQGAFDNMCRGGHMLMATKIWRRWHRHINMHLRRIIVASVLAATTVLGPWSLLTATASSPFLSFLSWSLTPASPLRRRPRPSRSSSSSVPTVRI